MRYASAAVEQKFPASIRLLLAWVFAGPRGANTRIRERFFRAIAAESGMENQLHFRAHRAPSSVSIPSSERAGERASERVNERTDGRTNERTRLPEQPRRREKNPTRTHVYVR